ncbi:gamma-glutamyltranspeptidase [Salix suchowensis]|nr:gamma-glutamyltranspeptidase [Salix suchowensis]
MDKAKKEFAWPTRRDEDTVRTPPAFRRSFFQAAILCTTLCAVGLLYFSSGLYGACGHRSGSHSGSQNPAYLIEARHGAVASENKLCSDIGVQTLKSGGNAVDSAIATTFCIGVVNMFSSGIGGGGFMTVRVPPATKDAKSDVFTIDFREVAPALANATMYRNNPNASRFGGLAVGVPGELRGLEEAYRRWGTLPWSRLVQPSIDLAKGWKVDAELARRITAGLEFYLRPQGRFLREGEVIRRVNLSRTLQTIANEGAGTFYKGPIADSIVRKVNATGGILSQADLENYAVHVDRALEGTFNGRKVYTSRAPTSGPGQSSRYIYLNLSFMIGLEVLLHMLNLVENYDFRQKTPLNVHRIVEILKCEYCSD